MALDKNLAKLNKLLSLMDEDTLTKEMFVDAFANVVNFIKKFRAQNDKDFNALKSGIGSLTQKLQNDNSLSAAETKRLIKSALDKALKDQSNSLNFVRDRVRRLRDGKDADETAIVSTVLALLPEHKETILDNPTELRDKLESLEGEEGLQLKSVKALEEKVKILEERPLGGRGGGGVTDVGVKFALGRLVNTETPTGAINSSNVTYTVANEINAVLSFGINGEVIHDDEYTFAGNTITFTTALDSSLSGLSFRIVYV